MARFDQDLQIIKEDVRARSDIVEIISLYSRLKRSGKSWTGLCPFHPDKKPSFSVSPVTQTYRCWSCGESGDVYTFIEKKENLDFLGALEFLARRSGIPFERHATSPEQISERERMFALNALAVRFFQDRLSLSPDAQTYLGKRALLKSSQEQWQLGYAPPDWEGLTFFLEKQRADLALAGRLGLIKPRGEGGRQGYYDTFRNRLIFPIHDIQGRVVGFGGRALGDDPAKYLNSEQSTLFDKSRTLYGLHFARKALSAARPAVFVEGYVDVITAHQAGFTQSIATLGTSMTEEHARMLVRYSPKAIICYDADTAGINATLRAAAVWESLGVEDAEIRVARLPVGEDPDSLLRSGRTAAFQIALDRAVSRIDFQIDMVMERQEIGTEQGRAQALSDIVPILAAITNRIERDRYVQKVAALHPAMRYGLGGAIQALHEAIEAHRTRKAVEPQARDRGYPLTEQANRAPLSNAPSKGNRSPDAAPGSAGANAEGRARYDAAPRTGGGKWNRGGRERRDPLRDYGPPPLALPALSGVEKAERQLIRALFAPEWRSYVLSRLKPALLITEEARVLFEAVSRTPAQPDGSVDPRMVLREIEHADSRPGRSDFGAKTQSDAIEIDLDDEDPYADDPYIEQESDVQALNYGVPAGKPDRVNGPSDGSMSEFADNIPHFVQKSATSSELIRELLEDSHSIVSNEPLNEAALADCIRRLERRREELRRRELLEQIGRDDLADDQRRQVTQQYHEKTRQSRGSPFPTADEDN